MSHQSKMARSSPTYFVLWELHGGGVSSPSRVLSTGVSTSLGGDDVDGRKQEEDFSGSFMSGSGVTQVSK